MQGVTLAVVEHGPLGGCEKRSKAGVVDSSVIPPKPKKATTHVGDQLFDADMIHVKEIRAI